MKFLIECTKGIAIGAGAILPGISSRCTYGSIWNVRKTN